MVEVYSDKAISDDSLMRAGIQKRLRDATSMKFNVVLSEALDRLSRNQEERNADGLRERRGPFKTAR